jgi:hypothetical protein
VLAFTAATCRSATLERLSLDDMIAKSTAIVRGTVTGSHTAGQGPLIYTHYTVQVSERFEGMPQGIVDVAVPGGISGNLRQTFPGTPQFRTGDDYVFFLWTGRSGLTQVIGLTQGLFLISPGADPTATRSASKELMLEPRTGHPVKDEALVMSLADLRWRIASTLSRSGGH